MNPALQTLLSEAERTRDAALGALAKAQQHAARLQQQAEQLHHYRGELRQRHPAGAGQAAGIERVLVHENFSGRLQEVIEQQQAQRLAALAAVQRREQALRACELRVASVRKLLQRRAGAQAQAAQRREQRQGDEAALQQHQRQQRRD